MAVVYNQSLINSRLQLVANAIDAGPGNGVLQLLTAGNTLLSSLSLARPCGVIASGVLTFSGMSLIDPSAAATGTANFARIQTSDGTIVVSGLTVGQSTSYDVIFTPTNSIVAGQTVAITAASITGN